MSVYQSRAERTQVQQNKPNRPVSSFQERNSSGSSSGGGKDGGSYAPPLPVSSSESLAAAAAASSSVFQPLAGNRSFKKSGYGRGSQSRINPATANSEACGAAPFNTSNRIVQNGDHRLVPSPDTSASGGAKPADMQIPSNAYRAIPKAPSSQSASGSSSSQKPSMPPKGDPSKPLTLQFGTINSGIANDLQIPARTSSAPPNLDEQQRDQARIESLKPASVLPIPAVPKQERQQQIRKDVSVAHQPGNVESYQVPQIKRDVGVSVPSAPVTTPPQPSVLPISGMPMPMIMPFQPQQPQISQFGGPSSQMQPPGLLANSLQITMTIAAGSASQVAQQIFVPGIQPHFVQQQALMHQGQGFQFASPIDHQLPQQLGNLGMSLNTQFPQQQPNKFISPHKTPVKITHPETHEELKLEKRIDPLKDGVSTGQRLLPNVIPQSQPTSTYTSASQMNYYPHAQQNSYSPSPHIFPSSITLASGQVPSSTQTPRYSYPVSQGQHFSFGNPSLANNMTGVKHVHSTHVRDISQGINLEGVPASASITARVQKPKAGASSLTPVVISKPLGTVAVPKSMKSVADDVGSYHRHDEINLDGPAQHLKSGSEPSVSVSFPVSGTSTVLAPVLSTVRILPEAILTPEVPAGNSIVDLPGNDDRKREPIKKIDSEKNNQEQQRNQSNASSIEGVQLSLQRITEDSFKGELVTSQDRYCRIDSTETLSTTCLLTSSIRPSFKTENRIVIGPLEGEEIQAASDSSGLEKEISSDVSFTSSSGVESDGISINEDSKATTSLDPMRNAINSEGPDTNLNAIITASNVTVEEMLDLSEKSEISNASALDFDDTEVKPFPTIEKLSTFTDPGMLSKQDDGDDEKVRDTDIAEFNYKMASVSIENDGSKVENKRVNVENRPADASLHSNDSTAFNSDIPSVDDNKKKCDALITKCDINNSRNADFADTVVASIQTASVSKPSDSLIAQKSCNAEVVDFSSDGVASVTGLGRQEKSCVVITKPKISLARRKTRKEILSKADAAGSSDLYNAYKGPVEKHEVDTNSESIGSSTAGTVNLHLEYPHMDVSYSEQDVQSKAELDDWENAADISTPKLQTLEFGQSTAGERKQDDDSCGYEANSQKKYSRDFLLTLSQQFTDLPVGFEIGSDIADILMISPLGKSSYPSSGRIIDRSSGASNRRLVGNLDDDKWMRLHVSSATARDPRLDVGYGAAIANPRPGHRNSRGQASNQFGGILFGPMPLSPQGGIPRVSPDVDRWQRARGLIPSPQTPLQVMHKAEKKYEVGKVADEEEAKKRQLKAILNKLTPQNFEKLFDQVKEVNIDNAGTLTGIISQIFDKALMEPTFCEMYANFCFHLADVLPDFNEDNERITFKRLLLNKCQEEFERGEREQAEANKVDEEGEIKQSKEEREEKRLQARRRMLGNIRLIGELYKKKMLTERIMHECIKKLLGQYESPDEEDIEALCKLMSTIGEMIDHPKAKEHMDFYFDVMKKLSTNQKLSSRVRFMLRDVIDLRKNKWQHRRKVEGPKKIEEVHRDAAQEKQAQSSRLARAPVVNNVPRRGQTVDHGIRGPIPLSTSNSQQTGSLHGMPSQARGYGNQDVRLEGRPQFESRTLTPTPLRSADELSPRDRNSYHRSREPKLDHAYERSVSSTPGAHSVGTSGSHLSTVCESSTFSEEVLQEKTISAIREFYSVKDETEVALCIKELNAPSFYRSVISLWITDSFERKDAERDLLSKLIINLCKSNDSLFSQVQLLQGFESVLSSLEDAINDAPRAAEFLGRIFAKIVMENMVPLRDIGTLLYEGGEEPGRLREIGLAAEVLGNILETVRSEKGGTVLNEIRTSSNLNLKDFLPRHPTKSKLDAFL